MKTDFDTLIVGQGLAGSLLAWVLARRGQAVGVIDAGSPLTTSRAAAGLVNPVTGQNLTRLWRAEDFLASAHRLYRELGEHFRQQFFTSKPMLRLFRLEKERWRWEQRCQDEAYAGYLGKALAPGQGPPPWRSPLGGFWQGQTGYLDTSGLLDALAGWLRSGDNLFRQKFSFDDLDVYDDGVAWRGLRARRLVFCEGSQAVWNPWFGHLPLRPVKGEILTLRLDTDVPDAILNAGKWLLPLPDGRCRFGATYERGTLDAAPTPSGQAALLAALEELLDTPCSVEVLEHRAGLRPGTRDRRPLLGWHRSHPVMGIFNGFGSRGSLLIPWHAERMADAMCEGKPLPAESDIGRFGGCRA